MKLAEDLAYTARAKGRLERLHNAQLCSTRRSPHPKPGISRPSNHIEACHIYERLQVVAYGVTEEEEKAYCYI